MEENVDWVSGRWQAASRPLPGAQQATIACIEKSLTSILIPFFVCRLARSSLGGASDLPPKIFGAAEDQVGACSVEFKFLSLSTRKTNQ